MAGGEPRGDRGDALPGAGTVGLVSEAGGAGDDGMTIVAEPPPLGLAGKSVREVLRDNLFKDAKNSLLTIVFGALLVFALVKAGNYLFFTARWEVIYNGPLHFYMVGNQFQNTGVGYGALWTSIFLIAAASGLAVGLARSEDPPSRGFIVSALTGPTLVIAFILSMTRTATPTLLVLATIACFVVTRLLGRRLPQTVTVPDALHGLPLIPTIVRTGTFVAILPLLALGIAIGWAPSNVDNYGGLLLTVIVAISGIAFSFPIGVMLALGRKSSFPLIRPLCVLYIELIRGVPLISLLFMGQFALGFLFPPGSNIPGPVPRAIIMITAFSAAYVAEIVRGGLQSVPNGQVEAGKAIGLSPVTISFKIVLPQALRNSIPALIGQFISLLKDVSLLVIIGQKEILGMVDVILNRAEFVNKGYTPEAYAFVGAVYWMLCYSMSRAAQRLETRLGVGTR
mgnify:CR=1 FL=1